jgi:large repetitive protein
MNRNRYAFAAAALAAAILIPAGCVPPATSAPRAANASAAARFADADTVRSTTLAAGVTHVVVHDARGPWTIHIVEVDASRCTPVLEARKPEGRLSARATTTDLAAGAMLAVNADFFRLPGGTPVGAQVTGGVPLIGPTDWPVFGVTAAGTWLEGQARLRGHVVAGGDSARLVQLNRPHETFTAYPGTPPGVTLFSERSDSVPADGDAWRVRLRLLSGDEAAGRAVVVAADSPAAATLVVRGEALLLARGIAAVEWARRRTAGDTVAWQAALVVPAGAAGADVVVEALGGFPTLLRHGRDVLHEQVVREAFGLARHPRTALGWTADRSRLYLVVVDGRQPPYSDGMSLPEMTWLFQRLGAAHALNLDGGGSTAIVIGGRLVNRPSDATGERPVGNALALVGCTRPAR